MKGSCANLLPCPYYLFRFAPSPHNRRGLARPNRIPYTQEDPSPTDTRRRSIEERAAVTHTQIAASGRNGVVTCTAPRALRGLMFERYDARSDEGRARGDCWERNVGSRGSGDSQDRDRDPRDVFTRDLDLPRGRERRPSASATASTRSTATRAARWRPSARSASLPKAISTTSETTRRARDGASSIWRTKG